MLTVARSVIYFAKLANCTYTIISLYYITSNSIGRDLLRDDYNEDDSENRRRIYEYIQKNPGAHLRMITRELGLAMGATQHHLEVLEKSGKIRSTKSGMYRHYYTVEILEIHHKILAFLRQETSRDILVFLLEHPDSTQKDIIDFKGFSPPTISWHMSRLVESGIVKSIRDGRTVRYKLSIDLQNMASLLKEYHPSIWDRLLGRFADLFLQLSSEEKGGK